MLNLEAVLFEIIGDAVVAQMVVRPETLLAQINVQPTHVLVAKAHNRE